MPTRSPGRSKTPKATSQRAAVPDSLVFRSKGSLRFVEKGWSKHPKLLDVFVDAISRTSMFDHLPLVAVGEAAAKPRGTLAAVKAAFRSGKSPCILLEGGKTIYSDDTTAAFELTLTPASARVTTQVSGSTLAELGAHALDDVFTLFTSLYDHLHGTAHLVNATAWTDWDDNTPSPRRSSDWDLRAIADILEPTRPPREDRDALWDAAQAIAKAKSPAGVSRTTHGDLVMLRWTADPSDARAADAAAVQHDEWMQQLVKNEPLGGSSTYVPD